MDFYTHYPSPLGDILLAANETGLTGLWFQGQTHYARTLNSEAEEREMPVLYEAKRWLDLYFGGCQPDFLPPLRPKGTPFQQEVWEILLNIPYGQTITYGEIAKQLSLRKGLLHMSSQAVGGAVGRNPISILIPCHRVLGTKGSLTGYAGGIDRKLALLQLEKAI